MEDTSEVNKARTNCLNCNNELTPEGMFCQKCGQSIKETKLSVLKLVVEAISNFFNLDGRLIHTLKDIFAPSKLTRAYVEGKRKYYMNPARLLIFSLLVLITVVMSDLHLEDMDFFGNQQKEKIYLAKQKQKWDNLMANVKNHENDMILNAVGDSIYGNINLDSLYLTGGPTINDFNIANYNIKLTDAFNLSGDELVKKYEVSNFWERLGVKQYQKMLINARGGMSYIIKNATWVLLILVFVMAAFLKLYYFRSKRYYIEHLVLLMYGHSLFFIAVAICLLFLHYTKDSDYIPITIGILAFLTFLIQLLCIKKYYKQGWFNTIIKMIMINFTYIFLACFIFIFGAIVSFLIF